MMTKVDSQQIKRYLETGDLKKLFFEELGWNRLKEASLSIPYKGQEYIFDPLAEKGGFKTYTCTFTSGPVPDDRILKQLDRLLEPYAHEKIIIFLDASTTNQVWLWVKREAGKPAAPRLNKLYKGQSAKLLAQKLSKIAFGIEEEDAVDVIGTYGRIKSGFDVDKVTTKFYERFKKEHTIFLGHIQGIPTDTDHQGDREWYASLMLNRLMFIYFIQKKGLLDNSSKHQLNGDKDYLQKRLQLTQSLKGNDAFYTFYRYFLRRLFHEGLSKPELDRVPELEQVIGNIPYINGGLFDVHTLEQKYPNIQIVDEAFEHLFTFFEDFDWYLDDRPARKGNEINPDVLGYIFEKYINQKQMGAYYTKEDITKYISKNTIIPFLFEKAAEQCPIAFTPDGPVWSLLRDNPDDYIYEAASWGANEPLSEEIAVGVHNVGQRTHWNNMAPASHALPTEIWREVVARRQRYDEVRAKMVSGEIASINDLITYNLDITRFAQDVITYREGTDLLLAFYNAIEKVTVLDPTCGSGAFLFAALNILKPLYAACLQRMRAFVAERDSLDAALSTSQRKVHNCVTGFRIILARVEQHHSQEYFVLKSIVINNLYGVDIMEEAVEICKLRLFLMLVAQIQRPDELEPLPDIDFNVMAGNTLIGYTNLEDVRRIIGQNVFADSELGVSLASIEEQAKEIERSEKHFRSLQTDYNIDLKGITLQEYKQSVRHKLNKLRADLNPYLAYEYGIDHNNMPQEDNYKKSYEKWLKTHQPFHWWVEFYEIMDNGGFNVIIGNPPWKELSSVKKIYTLQNYITSTCGNLYGVCIERMQKLRSKNNWTSFIVQLPMVSSDRMSSVRKILRRNSSLLLTIPFDDRPGKLFEGIEHCRSVIFIANAGKTHTPYTLVTSKYQRWNTEARSHLFDTLDFIHVDDKQLNLDIFPKYSTHIEYSVSSKLKGQQISDFELPMNEHPIYVHRIVGYYVKAVDFIPYFWNEHEGLKKSEDYKPFYFKEKFQKVLVAILNSSFFYWFWHTYGDGFHCGYKEVRALRLGNLTQSKELSILNNLGEELMLDLQKNAKRKVVYSKNTGRIEYDEFTPRASLSIVDQIDTSLARHYNFTDCELDFIINYGIKYRKDHE